MTVEISNKYYIAASLVLFLLSDLLLVVFPGLINYKLSYFFKGVVIIFYIVCAIRLLRFKEFFVLIAFIIIFLASQTHFFYLNNISNEVFVSNIRFFTWYFFFIIMMLVHNKVNTSYDYVSFKLLNKVALLIISIVCISILIGYYFDINLFRSYQGRRWGYKGILSKSVTASYFFIIVLNYLYYYHITLKKKYTFFLIVLFCSMLCGTKTIYLFNLLLLSFHIVLKKKYKLKSFWYILTGLLLVLFVFRNKIIEKTEFFWRVHFELYQKKGFMYSLTSFRSEMLVEGISHYNLHWKWINYLIGGRLIEIKYFEMSFFDLFYFFGVIGFLLFMSILIIYVVIPFYKKAKINGLFFLFSILLASFFTGQFFINSTVIILFFYFLITIGVNAKSK